MTKAILHCFEDYQKARISFVQTIAELSTHQQNVEALFSAGVMALLRPLLLDVVPSIQQSAAIAIGRLASYSEDLCKSIADNNIIPQLVESLPKQNRFFKKAACQVIKAVAMHNVELAQAVVDAGGLEPMVQCLNEFDPNVKEAAAFAIGQIAKHNEPLARCVVEARAVDSLILCLQEPELVLKRVASQALCHICKHTEQLAQPVAENGLDYICTYINYTDTPIKRNVINLLTNICKHSNELATLVISKISHPQKLLNCLKDEDEIVRLNSAMCISEIVNKSPELAKEICQAGAPQVLTNYIANSRGESRLHGILTMAYIASYNEDSAMQMINAGALTVLNDAMDNDISQVKCGCCFAMNHIGRHTPTHANEVAHTGALEKMVFFLMDPNSTDDLKEKSKKALLQLVSHVSELSQLEPLLHVASNDILIPVFERFAKYLKGNQLELSNFARNGGLKKILGMRNRLQEPLKNLAETICSYYPKEIVNYYDPEYAQSLIDRIGLEDSKPKEEEKVEEEEEVEDPKKKPPANVKKK